MSETIASFLAQIKDAAQMLEEPELLDLVAAVEEHTHQSTLRFMVVGLTGSGRGSLVNALLGQPRPLPTSPIPKAPIPIQVQYGETLTVELQSQERGTSS